jgi:hypothetical protein
LGGWIRSKFTKDTIIIRVGKTWAFNLLSEQGYLGARAVAYGNDESTKILWTSYPVDISRPYDPMHRVNVPYRLDLPGLHIGSKGANLLQKHYYAVGFVSYWIVIAILVAFSAWSHLSKTQEPQHK